MIKAIETVNTGCRFRSRLEARWAVFFDALGIVWEYEKEGYDLGELGWYLPDFWFPEWSCFGEVKAQQFTELEWRKSAMLAFPCLMFDGMPVSCFWRLLGGESDDFQWVHLESSKYKGRLWFSYGEGIDAYDSQRTDLAVEAARSARFEHGESG